MNKKRKIRFKVVQYSQRQNPNVPTDKKETDEVLEGKFIRSEDEYLVVKVPNAKLPYLVHPDSVISEEDDGEKP